MTQPVVYMIAGPNGAGKTTLALRALSEFFSVNEFVNADEIARGLNPLNPDGQVVAAGRAMLERIDKLIANRTSFAFETTGASRGFAEKIRAAQASGYIFRLFYVWLPTIEVAKTRVKLRVTQGGHNIPADTIARRYLRSVHNLIHLYLPLADQAEIYKGYSTKGLSERLIAVKNMTKFEVPLPTIWSKIKSQAGGSNEG